MRYFRRLLPSFGSRGNTLRASYTAPDKRFCWCNSGTANFTGRNWKGAPYPHIHSGWNSGEPHFWRELTDGEWADAMRDTPFREELTAERASRAMAQNGGRT